MATKKSAEVEAPKRRGRPRSRGPRRSPFSTRVEDALLDRFYAAVDARSIRDGRAFSVIEATHEAFAAWVAKEERA